MLVIFSAYATWNNIVFYAKEGYTKPASAAPSEAELPALKEERDILKRQLKNAQDLIDSLRQAVGLPGGPRPAKSHSLLDTLVGFLLPLRAHDAYAQEPPRSPGAARSSERPSVQQLRDRLRQYELQQQQLNEKLEGVREEKTREAPQQRLIKNWSMRVRRVARASHVRTVVLCAAFARSQHPFPWCQREGGLGRQSHHLREAVRRLGNV